MGKIVGFKRVDGRLRVAHGQYSLAKAALEYWRRFGNDGLVRKVPASRTHKDVDLALRVSDVEALEKWVENKEKADEVE